MIFYPTFFHRLSPTSLASICLELNSDHILQQLFMRVPPGVVHQSQNNIRVVMHCLAQQPPPRRHHQELIQYLRYHIREHRAFVGHAAFTIEDTYTLLTTACQCYIDQLPLRQPARAIGHRAQGESTSSSSTSRSNIGHQEPHLHIGMMPHQGLPREGPLGPHSECSSTLTSTQGHL